jgi:very-short-patch-repair endonuclease/predicted transcriptional regulator of viral defense system
MPRENEIEADMRRESSSRAIDEAIADLAARQRGAVARWQLLDAGVKPGAIGRRVNGKRLHVIHRGVYAVGHRKLSAEGRLLAAVLAGGRNARLSHASAAKLWKLPHDFDEAAHVVAPSRAKRPGIRFHQNDLRPGECTTRHGIPVTTPARTLLDCAATMHPAKLERAVREAIYQRLTSLRALRRLLRAHPSHRGRRQLSQAIEATQDAPGIQRSDLERDFEAFRRRHGLPAPELNVPMQLGDLEFEADCYWRNKRLIVELDHRSTHARRQDFAKDRRRDRVVLAAGIRTVRVAAGDLTAELAADLTSLLADDAQTA